MGFLKSEVKATCAAVFTAVKVVVGKMEFIFPETALSIVLEYFGTLESITSGTAIKVSDGMKKCFTGKYAESFKSACNPYSGNGMIPFSEYGIGYENTERNSVKNAIFSVLFYTCGKYHDILSMHGKKDSDGTFVQKVPLRTLDSVLSEMIVEKTIIVFDATNGNPVAINYEGKRENLVYVGMGFAFHELLEKRINKNSK